MHAEAPPSLYAIPASQVDIQQDRVEATLTVAGATLLFSLPQKKERGVMTRKFGVLVVDDEPPLRKVLNLTLTARGFAVEEAGSVERALDVAYRFQDQRMTVVAEQCCELQYKNFFARPVGPFFAVSATHVV
jgi:hypothetical protein